MPVSLAPVRFSWSAKQLKRFYKNAEQWPVDIVYLGETLCAKRRALSWDDWFAIGRDLVAAGKEVVISSNSLHDSNMSISEMQRLCMDNDFVLEVADTGYLQLLQMRHKPHVVGHTINVGTQGKLERFAEQGMLRWVMPREDNAASLLQSLRMAKAYERPRQYQVEATVHGLFTLNASIICSRELSFVPKRDCKVDCDVGALTRIYRDQTIVDGASFDLRDQMSRIAAWGADVFRVVTTREDMGDILTSVQRAEEQLAQVDLDALLEKEWQEIGRLRVADSLRLTSI